LILQVRVSEKHKLDRGTLEPSWCVGKGWQWPLDCI